jgi:type I restriction enzyme S subunit
METAWSLETIDSVAEMATEKIGLDDLTIENYISTENMLPDKQGVELASKLPTSGNVNAFRTGDVLFSNIRTYFKKVWLAPRNGGASADVVIFRPRSTRKIHNKFLYYLLSSDAFVESTVTASKGTKMPRGDKDAMRAYGFYLPPLSSQERIAGILSGYDELIENCQRRIEILESMARALYREWFVYFRYPGHESVPLVPSSLGDIPQGWDVRALNDVATVTYGFPFASKKFNTNGVGTPVIRIRDIREGSINTCTDEDADPKFHIKNEDILVGMDGDFHMCIWSSGHAFQNQRIAKFESNGEIGNFHLFLALESPIQTWNKAIVGTTVAHLGDMHIKRIQLVWPSVQILERARDVLEPMSQQIITLKSQIKNLRQTRDLLLPRLLSGQLEVEAIAS